MSSGGAKLRAAAAKAVHAVVEEGRSLDVMLREFEPVVPDADRALYRNLAFGTVRHFYRLREWQQELVRRRVKRRDRLLESLINVGLFQLTSTRIPDHAVVSETVAAARVLRLNAYAGLVNAALRRFVRDDLEAVAPKTEEARFNHPQWIIDRLRKDWPDDCDAILTANNQRAPMWLRVNTRKTSVAAYLASLGEAGIAFSLLPGLPEAVLLEEPQSVVGLPGFADGLVSVQDGAAQVPAGWLLADGAGRVLDACAAPGGKTAHLLELGGEAIELDALDVDAERLESVRENLERLSLSARMVAADAAEPDSWWDGRPYDRILLDAPCSASGVIRRHPDIKLLRRSDDIPALSALQARLLETLWGVLAPGGELLYVTCSVFSAENDAVVEAFLERTPDAVPANLLPNNNIRALMHERGPGYQLLPGTRGLDGFYYAGFRKQS